MERIRAPSVEISHDRDLQYIWPEEFELDDAISGYTCHLSLPFVTMPFQSLCQWVTRGTHGRFTAERLWPVFRRKRRDLPFSEFSPQARLGNGLPRWRPAKLLALTPLVRTYCAAGARMNDVVRVKIAQRSIVAVVGLLTLGLGGCPKVRPADAPVSGAPRGVIQFTDLSDPMHPAPVAVPFQLQAARNEWTSFAVQVGGIVASDRYSVRVVSSAHGPLDSGNLRAFQVLPMPVEVNPDYVRHTGLSTAARSIPRALLPFSPNDSSIALATVRDPAHPTDPSLHPSGGPVLLWFDVHVPTDTAAGVYTAACELADPLGRVTSKAEIKLNVFDFTLPAERHLKIGGQLGWDRLAALHPKEFAESVTPNLINRRNPRFGPTVTKLDQLMQLAEENRTVAIVPGLRPTVKWPTGEMPDIDWGDFDALTTPWLSGALFADHVPVGYWPLPTPPNFSRHDLRSKVDYWALAAGHFEQLGWLDAAMAVLPPGADPTGNREIEAEGAKVLAANPRLRLSLPLGDEGLSSPSVIPPDELSRVLTEAPGLISSARSPGVGADVRRRSHWLAAGVTDNGGGACDQRDVRVWAWLAFLRQAEVIVWDQPLPPSNAATDPADANGLVWFYPGSWFGVDQPVPTLQLKWLRRAEQDYEYLWLARDRGELIGALQMARLITKPVEVTPGEDADPAFSLMSGTPSQEAWDRAQELLAENIMLRRPGEPADDARQRALYIKTLQWVEPQERPVLIARRATWKMDKPENAPQGVASPKLLMLEFGLDIYNASDTTLYKNTLKWDPPTPGSGWQMANVKPVEVPRLQTYHVEHAKLSASLNLNRIATSSLQPLGLTFVNGYSDTAYPFVVRLPVAAIDQRDGNIAINGRLDDWSESDAIQNGPLVQMMNRPDLQSAQLRPGEVNAKIYGSWGRDDLFLAFSLEGLTANETREAHNDVYYQSRRAWGEDLSEALIQPVFADNSVGPVLHVVFKPSGALWVERKTTAANGGGGEWESVEGAALRYATATTTDGHWRGEAALPWKLITGSDRGAPALLRFNFSQHRRATCQSATWCGPVDYGRDDQLMGALYLRGNGAR